MSNTISTKKCKRGLATLWLSIGLFLFLIMIVQSLGGKYGEKAEEAWKWFLPTLLPTLLLIVGVLVADATSASKTGRRVDRFVFQIAFGLSLLYLLLVAVTLFYQPFSRQTPLQFMSLSNLWLGPFQGLVAAALGAFFTEAEKAE